MATESKDYIVTIDGPVGSGKSTIGRKLAERHGLIYLDTGAMYRAVALVGLRQGIAGDDGCALRNLCQHIKITFKNQSRGQLVFVGSEDVSESIRTPEISMAASAVSSTAEVREELVRMQREIGCNGGIVVDGRDAGTVIFPQARFKFFLDARIEERAKRRYKELVEKNIQISYNDLFNDIKKRDTDDSSRSLAPLKPAEDARIIDTTEMTIEDVISAITGIINAEPSSLA